MLKIQPLKDDFKYQDIPYAQTSFFAKTQNIDNRKTYTFVFYNKNNNINFYFLIVVLPFVFGKKIAHIPHGPIFLKNQTTKDLKEISSFLKVFAKQNNLVFIRLELEKNNIFFKTPLFAYHTSFSQPRAEMILDISPNIENIYNNFKKDIRRNIKKAQKNNLKTDFIFGKNILKEKENFIAINKENMKSHNKTTHTDKYLSHYITLLSKTKNNFLAKTYNIENPKNILSYNLFVVSGNTAFCPYGASTKEGKKNGAYPFTKYQSIIKMKELNLTKFNWGGISTGKQDSHLQGITDFKLRFGGNKKKYNDFYDLVLNWPVYVLYLTRAWLKEKLTHFM